MIDVFRPLVRSIQQIVIFANLIFLSSIFLYELFLNLIPPNVIFGEISLEYEQLNLHFNFLILFIIKFFLDQNQKEKSYHHVHQSHLGDQYQSPY